jgi:hypothetical protein
MVRLECRPPGLRKATKIKKEAERRQAHVFNVRISGCGAAQRGRSPVGVPPRHLVQRANAAAQLQIRASWDLAKRRALPAPACPSPASFSQTGHRAGRAYGPGAARERR